MSETLVTLQLRFATVDRAAVADLVAPAIEKAIAAGGEHTSISVTSYNEEEE